MLIVSQLNFHNSPKRRLYQNNMIACRWMIVLLLLSQSSMVVNSMAVPCQDDTDCQQQPSSSSSSLSSEIKSYCRSDGYCSNPFESGCFHALGGAISSSSSSSVDDDDSSNNNNKNDKKLKNRKRVCNSDDDETTIANGICRKPDIDYMEIRLFSNNWESSAFENWIIQILLSELLDVPTTIETGVYDSEISFYNKHSRYEYGDSRDTDSLEKATELHGNCNLAAIHDVSSNEEYETCAHMVPEVWGVKVPWVQELVRTGILEPPQALGMLGQEGWFVTKFTAVQDPSVTSYLGLMGEQNREKLARLFKRPTRWGDYCTQISIDNCTSPDDTAKRQPNDSWERDRFFVPDVYNGYFQYTDQNNCTTSGSNNCTGHFADYPCGWSNYVQGQLYYLNIALQSNGREPGMGGYTYTEQTELWRAANATKENLIMYWYNPDPMYQSFLGTDAEFQRISFQPPTQQCVEARNGVIARCSDIIEERVGAPEGICDDSPVSLSKLISSGLEMAVNDPAISPALKSPALDVLRFFSVSELQLGQWMDALLQSSSPRETICQWAVDNVDYLQTFIPNSYPRRIVVNSNKGGGDENNNNNNNNRHIALMYSSIVLGILVVIFVVITTGIVFKKRKSKVIQYAQVEFLMLLLAGAFLVGIGAVIKGLEATDASCVASGWFLNIGYTLELVPLIVKIAAINRLTYAAKKCKRIIVSKRSLFCSVFAFSFLVVPFLVLWTVLDPPRRESDYILTNQETPDGETIVQAEYYCASNSLGWKYYAVGWNITLLFIASVLAFQARRIRAEFNESSSLGTLIYSHFIFVVLRVITYFLTDHVSQAVLQGVQSLIFSVDTIAALVIYFIPKIIASYRVSNNSNSIRLSFQSNESYEHAIAGSSDRFMISSDRFRLHGSNRPPRGSNHPPLTNRRNYTDKLVSGSDEDSCAVESSAELPSAPVIDYSGEPRHSPPVGDNNPPNISTRTPVSILKKHFTTPTTETSRTILVVDPLSSLGESKDSPPFDYSIISVQQQQNHHDLECQFQESSAGDNILVMKESSGEDADESCCSGPISEDITITA